jgi:hypothetical protein
VLKSSDNLYNPYSTFLKEENHSEKPANGAAILAGILRGAGE